VKGGSGPRPGPGQSSARAIRPDPEYLEFGSSSWFRSAAYVRRNGFTRGHHRYPAIPGIPLTGAGLHSPDCFGPDSYPAHPRRKIRAAIAGQWPRENVGEIREPRRRIFGEQFYFSDVDLRVSLILRVYRNENTPCNTCKTQRTSSNVDAQVD